jgi:hypothetical protein
VNTQANQTTAPPGAGIKMQPQQRYTSPELPPAVGLHPEHDDSEEYDAALEKALDAATDEAMQQVGRADEAIVGPGVKWGLKPYAKFDPLPWLDHDSSFSDPVPRDDCPADVLLLFVWTGTQAQAWRATCLLRDMARALIRKEGDVAEAAAKAVESAQRRSKGYALGYYSSMARAAVESLS